MPDDSACSMVGSTTGSAASWTRVTAGPVTLGRPQGNHEVDAILQSGLLDPGSAGKLSAGKLKGKFMFGACNCGGRWLEHF